MTEDEKARRDEEFREPPAEFRSVPFWAWNDQLDLREVATQIRLMKEQGIGGVIIHSRDGLETPYMGKGWLEAVRAAVDTAKEVGLSAWLYDEDRWPSGSAGGKVSSLGDEYRAKGLTLEIRDIGCGVAYVPAGDAVALYRAWIVGIRCVGLERLDPVVTSVTGITIAADEVLLIFRIEVSAGDEWFNGEAPPDNLNPATVDSFIDFNYLPYFEAIGTDFGTTVPGIFTDEPSVHDRHSRYVEGRGWIPWTYNFARFFESRRGYDPFDAIPFVFFDGEGQERIRHDYWRTVTELFSESYTKKLASWCENKGLLFTGHYLWENQLGTATRTGGAVMPHYRFQHIPGMDLLCEQIEETVTVKQCTSVANQYGRRRVLSETYGCVGWEFSFEGQKWLGDWLFVMGVNLRCQHLALYSLKGCRKRDYPPGFNYNTSWWKHIKQVEDYFARLSAVLTRGEVVRELLVLHPASTAWCTLGSNPRGFADRGADRNLPELNAYGDEFNRFLRAILGNHYDFDLGDETILAEEGRVEVVDGVPSLIINKSAYLLVVIPPIKSIFSSTLALLEGFLDAGGPIVAVAPGANLLEGVPSPRVAALYRHPKLLNARDAAAALLVIESIKTRKVSLKNRFSVEEPELLYMLRRDKDGKGILFVVNTDRASGQEILVEVEGLGAVEELNPLTGAISPVEAFAGEGSTRFFSYFGPAGSRLYRFDYSQVPVGGAVAATFAGTPNFLVRPPLIAAFGPTAEFCRTELNALVLDRCSYSLDNGHWSPEMEVWTAQRELRETLNMRQVYYNGLAQRYLWIGEDHPKDGTPVCFRFSFFVKALPPSRLFLALEGVRDYRLYLNGNELPADLDGWFLDKSFGKVPLLGVRLGSNELILRCAYLNRMEVEDCFLLGDFAVDGERALAAEPGELRFGDWCLQGYPHYSGNMIYRFAFEWSVGKDGKAVLRLGNFSAVTVEVRVNGRVAGRVPWSAADGVDLGPFLEPGQNNLEIEVVGSPRNLLGPFHLSRGKAYFNEWSVFRPEGPEFSRGYVLHPYGLFSQIILSNS